MTADRPVEMQRPQNFPFAPLAAHGRRRSQQAYSRPSTQSIDNESTGADANNVDVLRDWTAEAQSLDAQLSLSPDALANQIFELLSSVRTTEQIPEDDESFYVRMCSWLNDVDSKAHAGPAQTIQ